MKAIYKYASGEKTTILTKRPKPKVIEPDDILIKVSAVAVCGMDIHIYNGKFPCKPPFIMGHEFVGKIVKTGTAVTKFTEGDRVVAPPHMNFCGQCEACRLGITQNCESKKSLGISRDGAMAEYVVIQEKYLHKIPEGILDKFATLIEPMTIVVTDLISRGGFEKDETIVITGAGQIALLAVVAAKQTGASKIIVIGQESDIQKRFTAAKALGADYTLSGTKESIRNKIMDITDNKGVDMIFEASGSEDAIDLAIDIVRQCGKMSLLGMTRKDYIQVNWDKLLKKMIKMQFNMMSNYNEIDKAIELFNNPPCDLSPLISHEAPLEEWESIFSELIKGNGIKAVLTI